MAKPESIRSSAFEQSRLPLAVVDGGGLLALWNPSFAALLRSIAGFGPEGFRSSLFDLIRERGGQRFDFFAAEILLGGKASETIETSIVDEGSRKRWLRVTMSLLEQGPSTAEPTDERFVLCSMEEVTDRVLREGRLREAKEEAEKATHTKSLFLANMSHEIRTPIQTILGVLELLHETELDGEQAEYATQVGFSAEVLLALINDILDFSKIEAGKLDIEATDFDLPSTVYQSVYLLVLDAHRKGLEVVVDSGDPFPSTIRGDPTRLRQILVNLLKNAIKFTHDGGITLSIAVLGEEGRQRLRFEVRDTGIGIPEELRGRLFTAFFQADFGAARKTGGTGLGLAISRHLVGLMGGSIGAEPNSPRGSIFWFEVPLVIPEHASLGGTPLRGSRGLRLLVVDDSDEARRIAVRLATRAGFEAGAAASGEEALSLLRGAAQRSEPFDLCLVDQNMPRMDGWRLASEITADTAINGVRLVLMVPEGRMGADAKMKLLRWFGAYVSKPLRPDLLVKALDSVTATDVDGDLDLEEQMPKPGPTAVPEPSFDAEVLVAEDHEVNRELFVLLLTKLGCRVTAARDGVEAVEIGSARVGEGRPFDIILTDIFMPRMNGYEASALLRDRGYRGPLVAVTASALKGEREKCVAAGMDDILVKPFRKRDLATLLETWLPPALGGRRAAGATGGGVFPPGTIAGKPYHAGEPELSDRVPAPAPAPGAGEPPRQREVFDWDTVIETFLGQESTVLDLLGRFLEKAASQVGGLASALEGRDFAAFREIAHSIKGASWNLAAKRLGDAARDAEDAGRAGDGEAAAKALASVRSAFAEFSALVALRLGGGPG